MVRRGGLKKGTAGAPTHATESTGQKGRHTFFSRHAPTTDRHDTEAHISSVFPLSVPTRILCVQIIQTARFTHVPQPRARTPHRRSADSARRRAEPSLLFRFTPSLGVFPMDPAVRRRGVWLPPQFWSLIFPLPSMDLLLGPSQTLRVPPPIYVSCKHSSSLLGIQASPIAWGQGLRSCSRSHSFSIWREAQGFQDAGCFDG